jgi:NADH:ubiquinone oxidoreductase subunit K
MTLLAGIVVVAFALFLIGLTGVVFAKPALAERFLMSFASSARAHYIEQACRLLIGSSLVVLSPAMWQTMVFRLIGWAIVTTSMGLLLSPWQWHHRFGVLVRPTFVRHVKLYAVGLLAFGCLLLYGVFAGWRGAT